MCKKKIHGTSFITHLGIEGEYLEDYIELLKPYFNIATHHHNIHHCVNKDAVLFYSYFPESINCEDCCHNPDDVKVQKKNISGEIGSGFYEFKRMDMPCGNVDRIHYNGRFVGFYCKQNNVLSLSDIPHSMGNQLHLKTILDKMVDVNLLHPVINLQL